jgi:dephospho-CoA kinase
MTKPTVIALLGRAGSGKTTASQLLVDHYGAQRVSFAAPLKKLAMRLWDFAPHQVYGDQRDKERVDDRYGFTPREAMQRLGEGARQELGLNVWIQACFNNIGDAFQKKQGSLFVIDDLRYPNEAEALHESGVFNSYIIKLVCSDSHQMDAKFADHPSERGVDEVDSRLIYDVVVSHKSPGAHDLLTKLSNVFSTISSSAVLSVA